MTSISIIIVVYLTCISNKAIIFLIYKSKVNDVNTNKRFATDTSKEM